MDTEARRDRFFADVPMSFMHIRSQQDLPITITFKPTLF
jgi:hypothetical protein